MSALMIFLAAAAALTVLVGVAFWIYGTFLKKPERPEISVARRPVQGAWNGKADSRGIR